LQKAAHRHRDRQNGGGGGKEELQNSECFNYDYY